MSAGMRELEAFIAKVESLADMNERVAAEAAEPVANVLRENCAKGVGPDGEAWAELEAGGKALRGAAGAISANVRRNKITLSLAPPYAYHNWGAGGSSTTKKAASERRRTAARQARSGTSSKFHAPRRQILPDAGEQLPQPIADAIADTAKKVFADTMGGR